MVPNEQIELDKTEDLGDAIFRQRKQGKPQANQLHQNDLLPVILSGLSFSLLAFPLFFFFFFLLFSSSHS